MKVSFTFLFIPFFLFSTELFARADKLTNKDLALIAKKSHPLLFSCCPDGYHKKNPRKKC